MVEYIDKHATAEHIDMYAKLLTMGDYRSGMMKAKEILLNQEIVQVVRCGDCTYYGSRRWCELHNSVFDDNAFCSYGERKEG